MPDTQPYGILFVGDPHVDDNGCDIGKLKADLDLVNATDGLYAACMGDLTNNWIGTLQRLYAHQTATDDEATELMEWLLSYVDWLFVILGNHDKWGPLAARMCNEMDIPYVSHGAMFKLRSGTEQVILNARHTHRGNSMYNASHGQLKQSYRGSPADIIIGAHIHTSAYTLVKNGVTDKVNHCIRVGAYKTVDDYADAGGFDVGQLSPSVMCVIDPNADELGRVTVFHNLEHGAMFLKSLRVNS